MMVRLKDQWEGRKKGKTSEALSTGGSEAVRWSIRVVFPTESCARRRNAPEADGDDEEADDVAETTALAAGDAPSVRGCAGATIHTHNPMY